MVNKMSYTTKSSKKMNHKVKKVKKNKIEAENLKIMKVFKDRRL